MTLQEIFNKVAAHLLAQGARSTAMFDDAFGRATCTYRGAEGRKCAVGVLIADEHYGPGLEGLSANSYEVAQAVERSVGKLTPGDVDMLRKLQVVHDSTSPDEWPAKLAQVAQRYELSTEEVL